jgi:glycosyltransferase involved in cell wall biosynthesis
MTMDISVVLPCLNEERTVGDCVRAARQAISKMRLKGEVVVVDNGSTDGSVRESKKNGARVVPCEAKGYGSALKKGFDSAKGRWVVMGDADKTYDFGEIPKLIDLLKQGADLAMGSRLRGRIESRAMPWLHRWVGTPVLTAILNRFFHSDISDVNCGIRAFKKEAVERMDLHSTGMEFAAEMVIKAARLKMTILETPVNYYASAPGRVPNLHTLRDGWRHLRFMLLLAPDYLFVYPGLAMSLAGLALFSTLLTHQVTLFEIPLGLSSLLFAYAFGFMGIQIALFGIYAMALNYSYGMGGESSVSRWLARHFTLEGGLVTGCVILLAGLVMGGLAFFRLVEVSHIGSPFNLKATEFSVASIFSVLLGIQVIFSSFYLSLTFPGKTNRK